jgi:hypothetical protein
MVIALSRWPYTGCMALTEADVEEFIALVQRDVSLRERVRKALIEDAFERLAATMAQSAEDDRVFRAEMREFRTDMSNSQSEMREFQTTTNERFESIDRRFDGIDQRFDGVDQRFDGVDQRFDGVDKRLDRLEGEMGNLRGEHFEHSFRLHFVPHVATRFRRPRPITLGDYEPVDRALDEGRISQTDWQILTQADATLLVQDRKAPERGDLIAVFELSRVVDVNDVRRAASRARILEAAGFPVLGCVAADSITADALALAESEGVEVLVRKRDAVEV